MIDTPQIVINYYPMTVYDGSIFMGRERINQELVFFFPINEIASPMNQTIATLLLSKNSLQYMAIRISDSEILLLYVI